MQMATRARSLAVGVFIVVLILALNGAVNAQAKPPLTFAKFFSAVSFNSVQMSPDGSALVIGTERPDYSHNRFPHRSVDLRHRGRRCRGAFGPAGDHGP